MNSKTRTKSRIADDDLYKDTEQTIKVVEDRDKADILSEHFLQVFVDEPAGEPPKADSKPVPPLLHMEVKEESIKKILQKLQRNKSPGPDKLHPRIIKETGDMLLVPLKILFENSLQQGVIPEDWRIANVTVQYTRREIKVTLETTDQSA